MAATIVLVTDQIVKRQVREHIAFGETIHVMPGLDFVHTTNRGIAFSQFPGHQRIVASLTAIALCVIAVALIDRLSHDGVTDFIAVTSHWPPFNVADIGIVCGAIIAGIGLMGERTD
jgi:lipoprotein signal peptidase